VDVAVGGELVGSEVVGDVDVDTRDEVGACLDECVEVGVGE
jgi:uncharacterized protein YggE